MIKNYLKIAFRNFWRHKLFTLIHIIGLSIGISAALVIYLIVQFDFTFDNFQKDGDRIYRVVTNYTFSGEPSFNRGVCGPLPDAVKTQIPGVEVSAPFFTFFQPNVLIPNNKVAPAKFNKQDNVVMADDRYFNLFQYKWLAGSVETSLNGPYQVVLTSEQAKIYFPSLTYDQMIGKMVIYDTMQTTVTGIVQTTKKNTDFTFHDFISFATGKVNKDLNSQLKFTNWGNTTTSLQLFIKLTDKTIPDRVEKQLNQLLKENKPMRPEDKGITQEFHLQQLSDIHFNDTYGNYFGGRVANKATLFGLLFLAGFLLLLGSINFINLSTAQAVQRAKEIGIRKTMGSSRIQLVFQFLIETFLITLLAVIISVALAPVILVLFADFIPPGVKVDFFHRPDIVAFLLLLTITVSLLSGFYPAIMLSGYKTVHVLKNQSGNHSGKTRNSWMRKSLTVTQFVIAQFFIMATLLVSKQIYYALHKDLGFKKDAIIVLNTPFKNRQIGRNLVFLNKLRSVPQIELVSIGGAPPSSDNVNRAQATYKDGKKDIKTHVQEKFGDENYINIYKIKLLAGRNLQPGDTLKAILINATYAKILGFKSPGDAAGRQLDSLNGDKNMQIVGVVQDFYEGSLHSPIKPLVILIGTKKYQIGTFHITLKPHDANGGDWEKALTGMKAGWKELFPDDDFDYHFFDETIAKFYESEQRTSELLRWATALSICISCLGLLGLAIYTTNQRTKEIGVRKVLGATVSQIVALLSTELMSLILLAFLIVSPVAWWAMNKWMQSFADRTNISWWIFAFSGTGMLLVVLLTSSFQTVKAAIANPVKSLRRE